MVQEKALVLHSSCHYNNNLDRIRHYGRKETTTYRTTIIRRFTYRKLFWCIKTVLGHVPRLRELLDDCRLSRVNIGARPRDFEEEPEKAVIFRQSDNQDHMELGWVFNCMVTVPFLMQAHSYKDKVAKGIEPNAGLFTYPMLQAADITLYDVDIVPVGEDQRQHLEYTREAVGKFNRAYGENLLKEPAEKIYNSVGVVPGTDGAKMSKSYGNTIPLFGTKEETEKAVMGIVTDSSGHRPENVYAIHRLLKSAEELDPIYAEYTGRYGDLKKMLAADLETYFGPMREKRNAISDEEVKAVLVNGVEKAKNISNQTLKRVRDAIGITI